MRLPASVRAVGYFTSFLIRSACSQSVWIPSLRTAPNAAKNSSYFLASFFFMSSRVESTFAVTADFIFWTTASSCSISRETLSGRSLESTTPFTNLSHEGSSISMSSPMKTFLT